MRLIWSAKNLGKRPALSMTHTMYIFNIAEQFKYNGKLSRNNLISLTCFIGMQYHVDSNQNGI